MVHIRAKTRHITSLYKASNWW